jgi:beta-galactosidase
LQLVKKWEEYSRQGGQLVLTCRTAVKDKMGHYPETKRSGMISELIGAQVEFFDNLPPDRHATVTYNNNQYKWNTWGEVLTLQSAKSLATHSDQYYKGQAAISRKDYNKGSVTYIGINSEDKSLEREVLKDIYNGAGIATENFPPGVIVDWVNGVWVAVNYSDKTFDIAGDRKKEFIIGSSSVPVAGSAVWVE